MWLVTPWQRIGGAWPRPWSYLCFQDWNVEDPSDAFVASVVQRCLQVKAKAGRAPEEGGTGLARGAMPASGLEGAVGRGGDAPARSTPETAEAEDAVEGQQARWGVTLDITGAGAVTVNGMAAIARLGASLTRVVLDDVGTLTDAGVEAGQCHHRRMRHHLFRV